MTIASVMLQPQRITRAAAQDPLVSILEDLGALATRAMADPEGYGPVMELLAQSCAASGQHLLEHIEARKDAALAHMQQWLGPLIDGTSALLTQAGAISDFTTFAGFTFDLLESLAQAAEGLTISQVSKHVKTVLDVLQVDLGLDGPYLEGMLWQFLDDMIAGLATAPAEADAAAREKRLAVLSLLRRLRRRLRGLVHFPQLNADRLAEMLIGELKRGGVADVLNRIACVGKAAGDGLKAGQDLFDLVSGSGNGTGPNAPARAFGAAMPVSRDLDPEDPPPTNGSSARGSDEYLWYATWLLRHKYTFLFAPDDFRNLGDIANKVTQNSPPIYQYLWDRLDDETQALARATLDTDQKKKDLRFGLACGCNRLVRGPCLYTEERFAGLTLKTETRELLAKDTTGEDLVKLNRWLLEDVLAPGMDEPSRSGWMPVLRAPWYWLRETLWWPGERVYIDRERKHLMLGDKPLWTGTNLEWFNTPVFQADTPDPGWPHYTFHLISAVDMERITAWFAILFDMGCMAWHLTSLAPAGHEATPVLHGAYDLAQLLSKAIGKKPLAGYGFFGSSWMEFLPCLPELLTILGSLQGLHTEATLDNRFLFWLTVWLGDHVNLMRPVIWCSLARDALLSILTLLNFRPHWGRGSMADIPDGAGDSRLAYDGVVDASVFLFNWITVAVLPRKDYTHPGNMSGTLAGYWFGLAPVMAATGSILGTFVAELLAWAWDPKLLYRILLRKFWTPLITFLFSMYGFREGDTDDGKFNPVGAEFAGYPSKSGSPYLLPYEKGRTICVGQANQGVFSHNYLTNPSIVQVYGFDFAHDFGDEVLASRAGTVVDYYDQYADGSTDHANFVLIRHDQGPPAPSPGNPAAPDPAQDRDVAGASVVTYAKYLHGAFNGVRDAFARWDPAVPPGSIVGTVVKQGMPVMLAGDTGKSFHNHLHMHVHPDDGAGNANSAYTIPFVFADAQEDDGVLKHGNWYTSSNERKTSPT